MAIFRQGPLMGASNAREYEKSRFSINISLYLANDARQSHSYYVRRIGNRTEAFEWYQFEWPWVTFNSDFKVTIIQRKITRKWYNMELHVNIQWPTNRKSYMIYRNAPLLMTLNDPYPTFKVTSFFDAEYLRNGTTYRHSFNGIPILQTIQWHEASRGFSATAELLVHAECNGNLLFINKVDDDVDNNNNNNNL